MTQTERLYIFEFLRLLQANNQREWFKEHHNDYERVRNTFRNMVQSVIASIETFDHTIQGIDVDSTTYRVYRDTRFSEDKSPYKTHLGAYINPYGKKSLHGGYYFHLEPEESGIGSGPYWLPSNVLTAVRKDIILRTQEFQSIVEEPIFKSNFPSFGMHCLKTFPKGFDRSYPHPEYLRPKDYVLWLPLTDSFFARPDWLEVVSEKFALMKPFLNFINETIDDYI